MRRRLRGLVLLVSLLAPIFVATSASNAVASRPRISARPPSGGGGSPFGWASSNWSGYAITGGPYTSATGEWTVPAVSASRKPTYSSSWVGIDGFSNGSLIQTGTEQDYYNGTAHYYASWEILPADETPITDIAGSPGHHMSASIVP